MAAATLPSPLRRRRASWSVGVAGLAAFSSVAVGAGLGRALLTTYLPVLLERIHDAPGLIGTVMLVNTAAGFLVPLVVGVWSDRLRDAGHGRTLPFVLGGSLMAAGGLAAVGLGHASSYLALALFAAIAYFGLNAITTAHRALIAEDFDREERAAATGWEEVALLLGTLAGVVVGGVLIESGGWAPFAVGAALLPVLAIPTVRRMRGRERPRERRAAATRGVRYYARAARLPGARLLLVAQGLWVLAYVGLAPFFVLYAERELSVRPRSAALLLAGFGIASGVTMLAAGTVRTRRQRPLLLVGAAMMGIGLLAVAASSRVAPVAVALLPAAVGFGLLTTLGFPTYSAFIPRGEEGAFSALYFSVRSVASAIAVPAAGWAIALTGSYRAMFALGGCAALAALVPLFALSSEAGRPALPRGGPRAWLGGRRLRLPPGTGWRAARYLGFLLLAAAIVLAAGLLVEKTALMEADEEFFLLLNGIGPHPALLDRIVVDPHIQNYFLLTVLVGVAAHFMRKDSAWRTMAIVAGSGLLAYATVRLCWGLWDRPRPEEVLGTLPANGHEWTDYPSFPSGHVAVTTAMVAAAATMLPRLRIPLWAYAALIAVTRVTYGAHFPTDVLAGLALGYLAARVVLALAVPETRPHRLRLNELLVGGSGRLRTIARATSAAALALFVFFALTEGPPLSPDGGVLGEELERQLQLGLLAVAAVGVAAAWWRDPFGAVLLVAGMALGVLAALQYAPLFAVTAALAFAVPGALFLYAWRRVRVLRDAAVVSVAVAAVLALGAFAALDLHERAYGPATPQSSLPTPPTWRVNWAWAGAVTDRGVTVKARLNTDAGVRLLVGSRPDLRGASASVAKEADDDRNDRIVAFRMDGLHPDRRYFYGLEVEGRVDPYRLGKFRTFPTGPSSFEIAFAGCARVGSDAAVFDTIRREHPLLFLSLGDFFYANIAENAPGRFLDQYDRALTSPAQGALYRSTAIAYVWDDHDFGGDGSDSSAEAGPAAQEIYRRAVPHYPLTFGPEGPIAQAFTVGRVRFILMDSRSAKTGETMLGARQLRWLKRQLLATRDRYALTVLFTSVPWIERAAPGEDGWGGYAAERAEISRFIARHRIRRLVMLGGDAHMLAIDDGSHTDYSGSGGAAFPLMHAGALDRPGHAKGGPYSEGAYPGAGQYGTMSVEDDGGPVRVRLEGHDYRGREIVRYSFSVPPLR